MAETADPNAPRWGSLRQQDAHELLVALLDRLQSEVLATQVRGGSYPEGSWGTHCITG